MTHGKSVVVPVEPTEAMIEAFYHAEGPAGPDRVVSWSVATAMARGNVFRHLDDIFANAYRAMLAAAPAPSSLAGGDVEEALKRLRVLRDQHRHGTAVTDADEYDADELDAILAVITPALSPEAPDWTARTEAAWAENNREEAPVEGAGEVADDCLDAKDGGIILGGTVAREHGADLEALLAENAALRDYGKSAAREAVDYRRKLAEAVGVLRDLSSWFDGAAHNGVWIIRSGDLGVDDAICAARTFLGKEAERG